MKTSYKNPFYNPKNPHGTAAVIETDVEPVEYRGFLLYDNPRWVDAVIDGTIETQCVTIKGAKSLLDFRILEGCLRNQAAFDKLQEESA